MMDRSGARSVPAVLLAALLAACAGGEPDETPGSPLEQPTPTPPLDADIWTADLVTAADGSLSLGQPRSAITRQGYDNQPHFLPDGSAFWFTATDIHDGQSDIWRFEMASSTVARVTSTSPESEYSATPLPDGSGLSVVRVEADSTQRIWRVDADGSGGALLVPDVAPVGYQAWSDETTLVVFVLGDPATLQVIDVTTGETRTVAEGIGRSIQPIPNSRDVSYTQVEADGTTTLMRLNTQTLSSEVLLPGVEGGDFHAWTPGATLLMAHEASVFAWTPGEAGGWREIADFSAFRVVITRLAVSPDGAAIAMVVEPGAISL